MWARRGRAPRLAHKASTDPSIALRAAPWGIPPKGALIIRQTMFQPRRGETIQPMAWAMGMRPRFPTLAPEGRKTLFFPDFLMRLRVTSRTGDRRGGRRGRHSFLTPLPGLWNLGVAVNPRLAPWAVLHPSQRKPRCLGTPPCAAPRLARRTSGELCGCGTRTLPD